jgi:hypothetical protein
MRKRENESKEKALREREEKIKKKVTEYVCV